LIICKKGFNAPVNRWFAEPLYEFGRDILSEKRFKETGLFEPKAVSKLIDDHENKKVDNGYRLYSFLFFMLWREMFLGKQKFNNFKTCNGDIKLYCC